MRWPPVICVRSGRLASLFGAAPRRAVARSSAALWGRVARWVADLDETMRRTNCSTAAHCGR